MEETIVEVVGQEFFVPLQLLPFAIEFGLVFQSIQGGHRSMKGRRGIGVEAGVIDQPLHCRKDGQEQRTIPLLAFKVRLFSTGPGSHGVFVVRDLVR